MHATSKSSVQQAKNDNDVLQADHQQSSASSSFVAGVGKGSVLHKTSLFEATCTPTGYPGAVEQSMVATPRPAHQRTPALATPRQLALHSQRLGCQRDSSGEPLQTSSCSDRLTPTLTLHAQSASGLLTPAAHMQAKQSVSAALSFPGPGSNRHLNASGDACVPSPLQERSAGNSCTSTAERQLAHGQPNVSDSRASSHSAAQGSRSTSPADSMEILCQLGAQSHTASVQAHGAWQQPSGTPSLAEPSLVQSTNSTPKQRHTDAANGRYHCSPAVSSSRLRSSFNGTITPAGSAALFGHEASSLTLPTRSPSPDADGNAWRPSVPSAALPGQIAAPSSSNLQQAWHSNALRGLSHAIRLSSSDGSPAMSRSRLPSAEPSASVSSGDVIEELQLQVRHLPRNLMLLSTPAQPLACACVRNCTQCGKHCIADHDSLVV